MALYSYSIPNLAQGVSQQPDAQRDPSQGEIQVNGMSSILEGLRKRDCSQTIAKVSASPFGNCYVHSILRDNVEEYLAVFTSGQVRVYDLNGVAQTVSAPYGYSYLSVTDPRKEIRAVTIADYTFVSNTNTSPAMVGTLAPLLARPTAHEALVWVKAANYGQTYSATVNGIQVKVTTAVAPVVTSGSTISENRISTGDIAESLLRGFLLGAPASLTASAAATTLNGTVSSLATTSDGPGSGLVINVTGNGSSVSSASISSTTNAQAYKTGDKLYVQKGLLNGGSVTDLTEELSTVAFKGTALNVATTGGTGSGLKVNLTGDGVSVTSVAIASGGTGYREGGDIYVAKGLLVGGPVTGAAIAPCATGRTALSAAFATTTDGNGAGLKVKVNGNGTLITAITVDTAGDGYRVGDKIYMRTVDAVGSGTDTSPVLVGTVTAQSNTDATQIKVGVVADFQLDTTPIHVATIASTAAGPLSGVTITRSGSVLWLQSASPITIATTDARANADITTILSQVQAFTELPTIAPSGYQIEITGDPGNNFDGYYVEFKPNSGSFGEGVWAETVSPGVQFRISSTTMPHLLVRLPNGTFYFGPANGGTQGGVQIPEWGERVAGDYDTAPDPSFIGSPINDIFIYKNRLGFLADENVILSRVRQFFEFFPETVTTVLDTDPIDVVASNNRVSVLRYAVPYQDELILFSSQYQFRFNAAETVLTPATAQITVLTQFEVDVNVRPQLAGGGIIFCQANGDFSMFREFSVRGAGTALTADAQDLTGYVSAFVPSNVFALTVNDTSNAVFSISSSTGFKNRIYVYKYFIRNAGAGAERAQSSWSYWDFASASEILQILCVRETLYCLVRYGNDIFMEKIPVQDRSPEPPAYAPYPLLLDRRISTTTETPAALRVAAGTYNATTNQTSWTLPYTATGVVEAWSGFSATGNGGVLLGWISSGTTITARGNWSTQPVYFGAPYIFRYRFTRFKLYKEIGGGKAAANVERTQIRNAKLRYHETAYFQVSVKPEGRPMMYYTFDATVLGSRASVLGSANPNGYDPEQNRYYEGVFNIPIMSRGERCIVEIVSNLPHPCKFSTCEWVGLVTGKARSLR